MAVQSNERPIDGDHFTELFEVAIQFWRWESKGDQGGSKTTYGEQSSLILPFHRNSVPHVCSGVGSTCERSLNFWGQAFFLVSRGRRTLRSDVDSRPSGCISLPRSSFSQPPHIRARSGIPLVCREGEARRGCSLTGPLWARRTINNPAPAFSP